MLTEGDDTASFQAAAPAQVNVAHLEIPADLAYVISKLDGKSIISTQVLSQVPLIKTVNPSVIRLL